MNQSLEFNFETVQENCIESLLKNLNANKATGLDLIPAKLVKIAAPAIASPLCYIINSSLDMGIFPDNLKIAKVKALYKKGSPKLLTNYRPISILPVFSKIFEQVANKQISGYLENNNLLNSQQYGFRKNRSTNLALSELTTKVLTSMNNHNLLLGIFLDFSKAFDTINHSILLYKLRTMHFSEPSIKWIANYLTLRKQTTVIDNFKSNLLDISCGVPQGSILGPTLFLVYINDLPLVTKLFKPVLYADDTNLFYESTDLNRDIVKINEELKQVENWCIRNKLTINMEKTNFIIMKNYQKSFNLIAPIQFFKQNLKETFSAKFLGVYLDNHLTWSDQIDYLNKQIRGMSTLITKCASFLPKDVLKLIYNSFINSKISYCIEAWGNAAQCHLQKILLSQKRIMRIIFNKPPLTASKPLFLQLSILPVNQMYIYKILLLAHSKYYASESPVTSFYQTRFSENSLDCPNYVTASGQKTIDYKMATFWNGLPLTTRKLTNMEDFKATVKTTLLNEEIGL